MRKARPSQSKITDKTVVCIIGLGYVGDQTSGNYRIVGTNPFSSPVPLEELNSYEFVYQSEAQPTVKIFKYLGSGES